MNIPSRAPLVLKVGPRERRVERGSIFDKHGTGSAWLFVMMTFAQKVEIDPGPGGDMTKVLLTFRLRLGGIDAAVGGSMASGNKR